MPDGGISPLIAASFAPPAVIIAAVAEALGTTPEEMTSKRAHAGLHAARQVAVLLFAEFTMLSRVEMGLALGRKDDSAGRYILLGARIRLDEDQVFRSAFHQARERLLQGFKHGV